MNGGVADVGVEKGGGADSKAICAVTRVEVAAATVQIRGDLAAPWIGTADLRCRQVRRVVMALAVVVGGVDVPAKLGVA